MRLTRLLIEKTSGEDVSFLQKKLKELKLFNNNIDGYFGQNTLNSVLSFQKIIGVKEDGIVGPVTWDRLESYHKDKMNNGDLFISYKSQNGLIIYDYLLSDNEYIKRESKKTSIILYHNNGSYRPDHTINSRMKNFKRDKNGIPVLDIKFNYIQIPTGVPYVIGGKNINDNTWDGKILRTFDDRYSSYYTGVYIKDLDTNSIGIELCNYGCLNLGRDGNYYNQQNIIVDSSEVVKLNNPFKGQLYFHRYTEQQIESLRKLILYLINKHDIKIEGKIYNERWFNYNESNLNKNIGIKTHSQIVRDAFDIFPQQEMMNMLNSL